ncbi:hypothetical protein KFL_005380010, partial [Klebsormidium nitens]
EPARSKKHGRRSSSLQEASAKAQSMESEVMDAATGQGVRLDLSPKERQALYLVRRSRRARHRARNSPTGTGSTFRESLSPDALENNSKVWGGSRGDASIGGRVWGREGAPLQEKDLHREGGSGALWGGPNRHAQRRPSAQGRGEGEADERLRADENVGHDTFSESLCSPATLQKLQDHSRLKWGAQSRELHSNGVGVHGSGQEGRQGGVNGQDSPAWRQDTDSEQWGRVERAATGKRAGQYEDWQYDPRRMALAQGRENGAVLREHEDASPGVSPNNVLQWDRASQSSHVHWHPSHHEASCRGDDSGGETPCPFCAQACCTEEANSLRCHDATCHADGYHPPSRENSHAWGGSTYPPPTPHPRQRAEVHSPNSRHASPKRAAISKQHSHEALGHSRLGRDPSAYLNTRFTEQGGTAMPFVEGAWQGGPNTPLFGCPSSPLQTLPPRFSQPPSPCFNHESRQGAHSDSCRDPPRAPHGQLNPPQYRMADGSGAHGPHVSGSDELRRESEDRTECLGLSSRPLSRTYTAHCLWDVPPGLAANLAATYPPKSAPFTPYESGSPARDRFVRPLHRFPDLMPLGGVSSPLQEPPLISPAVHTSNGQAASHDLTPGRDPGWAGVADMDASRGDLPALYPLFNQREAPFHTVTQERGVKTFASASDARSGPSLIGVLRTYYGTRTEVRPPEGARKLAATYPGNLHPGNLQSAPDVSPKGTGDSSQSPPLTERRASVPGNVSVVLSRSGGGSSHVALRPPSTPRLNPSPRTRSLLRSSTAGESQNEGATGRHSGGAEGAEIRAGEGVGRFQEKGEESKGSSGGGPRKERDRERFQRADAENERERSAPEGANPQVTPGDGTTPDQSGSGAEECSPALERLVYSWLDGIASRLSDVESDRAVTSSGASDGFPHLRGPVRKGSVGGGLPGGSAPGKTGPQEIAGGVKQHSSQHNLQPGTSQHSGRSSPLSVRSSGTDRKGSSGSSRDFQSTGRSHGAPHADAGPCVEAAAVPQNTGGTPAESQRNERNFTTAVPSTNTTSSEKFRYEAEVQRDHATLQDWVTFAHDQQKFQVLQAQGKGDGGNERGDKKRFSSGEANGGISATAEFEFLKPHRRTSPLSRSHPGSNCSTPTLTKPLHSEANRLPVGASEAERTPPAQNGNYRSGRLQRNERQVVSNDEQAESLERPQSADAEGRQEEQGEPRRGFPERLLKMQRCQICCEEIGDRDAVYAPPGCWHFCHFECVGHLLLDKPMSCAYCTQL